MAKNQHVRVNATVLRADSEGYLALGAIADYRPVNPAYEREPVAAAYRAWRAAEEAEVHAVNALAAARDATIAAQWEFHNCMLGVKQQVVAQYGPNSDEVAALGMKKQSERRRPSRSEKQAG